MDIRFYLNDGEDDEITRFTSIVSNPFNIGDVISLRVTELRCRDFNPTPNSQMKHKMVKDNDDLIQNFDIKKVKIVSDFKQIRFNLLSEPRVTIEYFCEFV